MFTASIFAGIIYGILFPNFHESFEDALDIDETENNFTIFVNNFFLSALNLITAGMINFFLLFMSFSIASSFFFSQGIFYAIPLLFIHGAFELMGILFFGLAGFYLLESKIFKIKSKLNLKNLLFLGFVLLLVASLIEYGLFLLLSWI